MTVKTAVYVHKTCPPTIAIDTFDRRFFPRGVIVTFSLCFKSQRGYRHFSPLLKSRREYRHIFVTFSFCLSPKGVIVTFSLCLSPKRVIVNFSLFKSQTGYRHFPLSSSPKRVIVNFSLCLSPKHCSRTLESARTHTYLHTAVRQNLHDLHPT